MLWEQGGANSNHATLTDLKSSSYKDYDIAAFLFYYTQFYTLKE
jgi:hypothetical protein